MEPNNKMQHNSQTALFAIAIVLSLGVGFYMGYQTGFDSGGQEMHEHMHAEMDEMMPHTHTDATAATHAEATPTTGDAMKMMDMTK